MPRKNAKKIAKSSRHSGISPIVQGGVSQNKRKKIVIPATPAVDAPAQAANLIDALGSVIGRIEIQNIHNDPPYFDLYPIKGAGPIKCYADKDLFRSIAQNDFVDGRRFLVNGRVSYKDGKTPVMIKVKNVRPLRNPDELPELDEVREMLRKAN